jgi:hypothetical protein
MMKQILIADLKTADCKVDKKKNNSPKSLSSRRSVERVVDFEVRSIYSYQVMKVYK